MNLKVGQQLYTFEWHERNPWLEDCDLECYYRYCGCCGFLLQKYKIREVNDKFRDVLLEGEERNILFHHINSLTEGDLMGLYTTTKKAKEGLRTFLQKKNQSLSDKIKENNKFISQIK